MNPVIEDEVIIKDKVINLFALGLLVVCIILFLGSSTLIWGWAITGSGCIKLLKHLIFWLIPVIIIHEGLHGLVWALLIKGGFKNIKFGFNREMMAPYTHCKVEMSKNKYILGGLSPLFLMGIIPGIISLIIGNTYFLSLAMFCTWSSAGDIISTYFLRKVPATASILDHPKRLGFIIIKK